MTMECLFNSRVPLFLKSNANNIPPMPTTYSVHLPTTFPFDSARRIESVQVELFQIPTIHHRKALELRLSDLNDPLFLWQHTLTEEDFYALRSEQNLLIDYHRFPFKLIELLQQCIAHWREEQPRFAALLQLGSSIDGGSSAESGNMIGQLSLVETTSFRQIVHLTLRLSSVSEQTLRRHLSELVKNYKEEIEGLRSKLPTNSIHGPTGISRDDPILGFNRHTIGGMTTGQESRAAYEPSKPAFNEPADYRSFAEKCHKLEMRASYLNEIKDMLEKEVTDLRTRLSGSLEETCKLKEELFKLTGPSPTEHTYETPEAQLRAKEAALKRANQSLEEANSSRKKLESENAELHGQLVQKEHKIDQYTSEINKANEIIRKLQEEIHSAKSKAKSYASDVKRHEKHVREIEHAYELAKKDFINASERLQTLQTELKQLQESKTTLANELEESKKLTEANEKVIEWLHQQINEEQLDRLLHQGSDKQSPTIMGGNGDENREYERLSPEALAGRGRYPPAASEQV